MAVFWRAPASGASTLANRPAASGVPAGTLWLVSDDDGGTLWRSDGTSWTKAGPGASEVAGGSSSAPGEVLMQDGIMAPPVPIETEAQDDWLYEG